ncbi:YadA C-terminal domain-containing protein [Shewanella schlegeliana]|uniref:YadA C-terminal domain-containing protein n=1 Tax=Shewanella schlegeliana TaxID=190308 RepID=A0ABS1T1A1_9GAMM|nr:YadA C-terminal domain-containing protein [Shewanella schlegeliana]MBL4914581.1 YadA C-terminal domain-containing protein [Shewanella schlegeliana]MCL1109603.1 YadA C-terminal domain-containing protein [Shewanella schlegeliana]GIU29884.1 hypothetical protein TUM4433_19690 [Shewanella schlegeliana]
MKKSIIALSVLSVLSINLANAASSIERQVKENKGDIDFIYEVTHRQDKDIMKLEYEATQSRNDINQINGNFDAMADVVESHQESLINLESVTNSLHRSGEMEAARLEKRIDEVASNSYDDAQLRADGREFVNSRLQSLDSSVQTRMQDLSADVDTRLNSAYTSGADEAARLDERIDSINTDKFDDAQLRADGREFVNSRLQSLDSSVQTRMQDLSADVDTRLNSAYTSGADEAARLDKRIDDIAFDDSALRKDGVQALNSMTKAGFNEAARLDKRIDDIAFDDSALRKDGVQALNSMAKAGFNEAARLDKRIDDISFDDSVLRKDGVQALNSMTKAGFNEAARLDKRIDDIAFDDSALRKDGVQALNSMAKAGFNEAARLDKRIDDIAFDDSALRKDGVQALKSMAKAGFNEAARLDKRIDDIAFDDSALRKDGAHALNSMARAGINEAARLDKRIDRINRDGYDDTQLRREASEYAAHVNKDVDNLFKGVSQNFHAITDLKLEHEVLADKGEVAYNSLRAEGAREVAKLESVANGVQRTGEIERVKMNNSIRKDAEQALNSMTKAGFNEAARLDKRIDNISFDDSALRKDAEQALSGLSKGVDSRMNHLANSGADEAARLNKRIDDISFDDSALRKDAEQALSGLSKGVDSRMSHLANSGADEAARLDKRIDEVAEKGYDDSQIRKDGQVAYDDALAKGEGAYKDLAAKGQDYVDTKFQNLDGDFKEAQQAMVVVQKQTRQNHEHIGENRQRIADVAAEVEAAKNSGGTVITDDDLKAARAEANQIANNAANKAIEDAVSNVEIDADTAKAVEAEVAKVAEKAIAEAVSKVDTDAALKEFFDTLSKQDRAIRGDGAAQVARLDGRIDANTKAIEENSKKIEALENRIDGFQDYMNENAAMTNALSGLPQPYGVGKVQVGVGLGFASDKKAVAIGMGYRATDAVVIRAGISKSAGSRGDVQGNLAVGYEF